MDKEYGSTLRSNVGQKIFHCCLQDGAKIVPLYH